MRDDHQGIGSGVEKSVSFQKLDLLDRGARDRQRPRRNDSPWSPSKAMRIKKSKCTVPRMFTWRWHYHRN